MLKKNEKKRMGNEKIVASNEEKLKNSEQQVM